MQRFARHRIDRLRKDVRAQLAEPAPDRATAEAAIIHLMDSAYLRVGSERNARRADKPTFGAATLQKRQVQLRGDEVLLRFRGKAGVRWVVKQRDALLADAIRVLRTLPGPRLFQYRSDDGKVLPVTAPLVRERLAAYDALPKDFRTLHANRLFRELIAGGRSVATAVKRAAERLHHEEKTFLKSYLDPRLLHGARASASRQGSDG